MAAYGRRLTVLIIVTLLAEGAAHLTSGEESKSSLGEKIGNIKDFATETAKNYVGSTKNEADDPGVTVEDTIEHGQQVESTKSWADWAVEQVAVLADNTQNQISGSYNSVQHSVSEAMDAGKKNFESAAEAAGKFNTRVMDAAASAKDNAGETLNRHFSLAGSKLSDAQAATVESSSSAFERLKETSSDLIEGLGLKQKPKQNADNSESYITKAADILLSTKDAAIENLPEPFLRATSDVADYVKVKSSSAKESVKPIYDAAVENVYKASTATLEMTRQFADDSKERAQFVSETVREYANRATGQSGDTSNTAKEYASTSSGKLDDVKEYARQTAEGAFAAVKEYTVGGTDSSSGDSEQAAAQDTLMGSAKEYARITGEKIGDSYNVTKQTIFDSSQAVQETAEHASDTAKEYISLAGDEIVAAKDGIVETATEASKVTKDYVNNAGEKIRETYDAAKQKTIDSAVSVKEKVGELSDAAKCYTGQAGDTAVATC